MQTTTTDRPTPTRGIVVTLYHGKVVEWCRGSTMECAGWGGGSRGGGGERGPALGPGIPRAGEGS